MDKKILLIFGVFAVVLVLFGCTQNPPANNPQGGINIDTASIDAEINSSDATIDSSVTDVPDVPDVTSGDLSTASAQSSDIVIDDAALLASIDAADSEVSSASGQSPADLVSDPNLNIQ